MLVSLMERVSGAIGYHVNTISCDAKDEDDRVDNHRGNQFCPVVMIKGQLGVVVVVFGMIAQHQFTRIGCHFVSCSVDSLDLRNFIFCYCENSIWKPAVARCNILYIFMRSTVENKGSFFFRLTIPNLFLSLQRFVYPKGFKSSNYLNIGKKNTSHGISFSCIVVCPGWHN